MNPSRSSDGKVSVPTEDCLRLMLMLEAEDTPISIYQLHRFRNVGAASMLTGLKRMDQQGLIAYRPSAVPEKRRLEFTEAGRGIAHDLTRRHRLVERFLYDVLRCPLSAVYDEADELEHTISERVESRIRAMVGDQVSCPHGNPIHTGAANQHLSGRQLSTCSRGPARITRMQESAACDPLLMRWLEDRDLIPGTEIEVIEVAAGNVLVNCAQGLVLIPTTTADVLFAC